MPHGRPFLNSPETIAELLNWRQLPATGRFSITEYYFIQLVVLDRIPMFDLVDLENYTSFGS